MAQCANPEAHAQAQQALRQALVVVPRHRAQQDKDWRQHHGDREKSADAGDQAAPDAGKKTSSAHTHQRQERYAPEHRRTRATLENRIAHQPSNQLAMAPAPPMKSAPITILATSDQRACWNTIL